MTSPASIPASLQEIQTLIGLFFEHSDELGRYQKVEGIEIPAPYRDLLDHEKHMTVTVEAFHRQSVDVRVLQHESTPYHYQREIVLVGQTSQVVVQYGIVRLNPSLLRPEVWHEIASRQTPLGRVLIKHKVLREVELVALWRFQAGKRLAELFECDIGTIVYGRTAHIHCDGMPAIELLEIVAPDASRVA